MKTAKINPEREPVSPLESVIRELDIADLNQASWNARKSYDPASIEELAASIRLHSIQVPLIVRMVDPEDGLYEIVAGHRRFHAAQKAGLQAIPCIVRNLTDEQAQEIGLVDNLQREDVPAMEEAVAFQELLTRLGSIAAVAARVGKEQGYVAKRLKLCSLSLCAQDALREKLITIEHALLLARLGADEQDAALKWCLDPNAGSKTSVESVIEERIKRLRAKEKEEAEEPASHRWRHTWEPRSVPSLRDHIASDSGTPLSRAPWPLDADRLLPDVPACVDCPQNTSANAPLFADLQIGEPTCTDGGCFKAKTQAFVQIQARNFARSEAERSGKPPVPGAFEPVRVSWKSTSTAPRMDKETRQPSLTQIFKDGQWEEAKKKCEHARLGVTVGWSDVNDRGHMGGNGRLRKPGEIVQACIEPKCKVHAKAYERASKSAGQQAGGASPKETAADQEQRKQAAIAENKIRGFVVSAAIEKVKKLPEEFLRELILDHDSFDAEEERMAGAILPGWRKLIEKSPIDGEKFAQAVALLSLGDTIACSERWAPDWQRKDLIAELKKLGYDASKAWDKPKAEKPAIPAKKKSVLSAADKKRIAAAQKKRWASAKKAGAK